jgi:hypothetical protein
MATAAMQEAGIRNYQELDDSDEIESFPTFMHLLTPSYLDCMQVIMAGINKHHLVAACTHGHHGQRRKDRHLQSTG